MPNPIPREIKPNMSLLKNSPKENPTVLVVSTIFFHGWKRDLESADTEKKYGKNIKIFEMASKKWEKYDFIWLCEELDIISL